MSRNFNRNFFKILQEVFANDTRYEINKNKFEFWLKTLIITAGASVHGVYALTTDKNESSIVVEKYKMVRNGFTEFMIIDDKGRHYNVNNSLWYWKWDSVEGWTNIKKGEKLYFKYYGWRVPFLGLFPNIYMTDRADFLNSMTSSEFRIFKQEKDQENLSI